MSEINGIHISFDIVDEFTPRVPRQRCPGEDETVPRICVAEDILNAVNAVPQAGLVMENMKNLGLPVIIHAYYLTGEGMGKEEVQNYVPDAKLTGEFWLTEKPREVRRVDYEIVDFTTETVKDPFGHDLTAVVIISFNKCEYQDNVENFLHSMNGCGDVSKERMERARKIFREYSFRTVISNIGDLITKNGDAITKK